MNCDTSLCKRMVVNNTVAVSRSLESVLGSQIDLQYESRAVVTCLEQNRVLCSIRNIELRSIAEMTEKKVF